MHSIFMDLQEIFIAFTGKVVPQAGKTEFRSACRRHGSASVPVIKEIKLNTRCISIHTNTHTHRYTHIRQYDNTTIRQHYWYYYYYYDYYYYYYYYYCCYYYCYYYYYYSRVQ